MASGFGLNGGTSRCFPFWQEFLACYVVNTSDLDDSGKRRCVPALEDYMECLHHRKEQARVAELQAAYRAAQHAYVSAGKNPSGLAPGAIRTLGLLQDPEAPDEKGVPRLPVLPVLAKK